MSHDSAQDSTENQIEAIYYDEEKSCPLIQAILQDDFEKVKDYLTDSERLNPADIFEYVPLVAAVYKGNLQVIQALIDAGAKLNAQDFDIEVNATPLGMAIQQKRIDLVQILLNAGASPEVGTLEYSALSLAVQQENLPLVKRLLEAGADPNTDMEDDYRVIMGAACCDNLDLVKCLVAYGAEVSTWSQGSTAIMLAAQTGHKEIYDYLYPLVDDETRRYADEHGQKQMMRGLKRKAREVVDKAQKDAEKLKELGSDPESL